MKRTVVFVVTVVCFFMTVGSVAAGDAAAGKARAVVCAGCHGAKGISANPLWPSLAGQHARYLEKQLKDYKSGVRKDPMMEPQAKMLSEADMANLAAYYQSLSCK